MAVRAEGAQEKAHASWQAITSVAPDAARLPLALRAKAAAPKVGVRHAADARWQDTSVTPHTARLPLALRVSDALALCFERTSRDKINLKEISACCPAEIPHYGEY